MRKIYITAMIDRLKQAIGWRYDAYKQAVRRYLVKSAVIRPFREYRQQRQLLETVRGKIPPVSSNGRAVARYKVAVVGAGTMGMQSCVGLQTLPQVEIVAVVDQNPHALEQLRQQVHLPDTRCYPSVEALLKEEKVDVVSIATNTTSHLALARLAVEAGIQRLIVEKPMGNSVAEARDLARLCADRGVKLAVNQGRRWSSDYAAVKRCVEHGYIGSLRQVYAVPGPGGLATMGVHFFDLIAYLADSPLAWVVGFLDKPKDRPMRQGPQFKDPGGYAVMGLQNGVRGYLDNSDDLKYKNRFAILQGDAGRIEIDERLRQWHLDSLSLGRRTFQFNDTTQVPIYFAKVVAQMVSDTPPSCGSTEGIGALEGVVAAHLSSSRANVRIHLPLQGKDAELEFPFP
jgi:predicted dehydrogenase